MSYHQKAVWRRLLIAAADGRPSSQNIANLLQDVLALCGKQLQQANVTHVLVN